MTSAEIMLLERCAAGPVSFTHAPTVRGNKTKLVRSTLSPSQQPRLRDLAMSGHVAQHVSGCMDAQETHVTYTLTAAGRAALGLHKRQQQPRYAIPTPTESQLERASREPS